MSSRFRTGRMLMQKSEDIWETLEGKSTPTGDSEILGETTLSEMTLIDSIVGITDAEDTE
jgi:hypothetical protein